MLNSGSGSGTTTTATSSTGSGSETTTTSIGKNIFSFSSLWKNNHLQQFLWHLSQMIMCREIVIESNVFTEI